MADEDVGNVEVVSEHTLVCFVLSVQHLALISCSAAAGVTLPSL
jgi:hypothetical protein